MSPTRKKDFTWASTAIDAGIDREFGYDILDRSRKFGSRGYGCQ